MTLTFVGKGNTPTYIALSTDISGSKIDGVSIIGATVYTTDDQSWYIVTGSDLLLGEYVSPPTA